MSVIYAVYRTLTVLPVPYMSGYRVRLGSNAGGRLLTVVKALEVLSGKPGRISSMLEMTPFWNTTKVF